MIVETIFLLLIVASFKYNKEVFNYLEKEKTFAVRGIMAIAIAFSHLHEQASAQMYIHRALFPATVAVFFFYSGYGLVRRLMDNRDDDSDYLHHFFRKRLAKIGCSQFISALLWLIVFSIVLGKFEPKLFAWNFFRDWFTISILFFYIVFRVIYNKPFDNNYAFNTLLFCLTIVMYICVCRKINLSSTWYGNGFAFPLGLLWGVNKERIDKLITNRRYLWWVLLFLCLGVTILSDITIYLREQNIITFKGPGMIAGFALGVFYPVLWNVLMMKLSFRRNIWYKLGILSYDIYLMHKLVKEIWITIGGNHWNTNVFIVCCVTSAIIAAIPVYFISKKSSNYIKYSLKMRNHHS